MLEVTGEVQVNSAHNCCFLVVFRSLFSFLSVFLLAFLGLLWVVFGRYSVVFGSVFGSFLVLFSVAIWSFFSRVTVVFWCVFFNLFPVEFGRFSVVFGLLINFSYSNYSVICLTQKRSFLFVFAVVSGSDCN